MKVLFIWLSAIFHLYLVKGGTVCYGQFGCFSDKAPFDHYLMTNPQPPKDVGTFYKLYRNGDFHLFKDFSNKSVDRLAELIDQPNLKVVIHGMLESSSKAWVSDMTKSLLQKERTNVLVVDWGKGALSFVTGGNSRLVGAQVAYLLKKIFQQSSIVDKNVHIIGFSLGAHVAGFAGKRLIKDGYKLGRITGLDPGDLPFGERIFDNALPSARLDLTDADFVDNIHTDTKGLGMLRAIGHLDFYPNGGAVQPGCGVFATLKALTAIKSADNFFRTVGCNHIRAVDYFSQSISNSTCRYRGYQCASYDTYRNGNCVLKHDKNAAPIMGYDAILSKGKVQLIGKKLYLDTVDCKKPTIKKKIDSFKKFFTSLKSLFSFS